MVTAHRHVHTYVRRYDEGVLGLFRGFGPVHAGVELASRPREMGRVAERDRRRSGANT